jgi:transposase
MSSARKRVGLYIRFQKDNFHAVDVGAFLRAFLRQLRGNVLLLWDQGKIHKGPEIRAILEAHPRLHTDFFPGYSPELNPPEFLWRNLKHRTANGLPFDTRELRQTLHRGVRRARQSQTKLRGLVEASGLPAPFDW